MFILILQSSVVSVIFIFLIHYLVKFFKNTLTTPKIKDFVTLPANKYKKMFDTMNGVKEEENYDQSRTGKTGSVSSEDMKNELKNFMKTHLSPSTNSSSTTLIEEISEFSPGEFTPLSSTFSNF
jgi:hypothetical protein